MDDDFADQLRARQNFDSFRSDEEPDYDILASIEDTEFGIPEKQNTPF